MQTFVNVKNVPNIFPKPSELHSVPAAIGCHRRRTFSKRRGVAVLEFAVTLPILFLIVFGSIEACNAIFLQQFITEVSYLGAISAAKQDATTSKVTSEMNQLLTARGINSVSVSLTSLDNASFETLTSGQNFKVRVSVPYSSFASGPMIANHTQLTVESIGRKQ